MIELDLNNTHPKLIDIYQLLTTQKSDVLEEIKFINNNLILRCQTVFLYSDCDMIDIFIEIKDNNIIISDLGQSVWKVLSSGWISSKIFEQDYFQKIIDDILHAYNKISKTGGILFTNITEINRKTIISQIINLCQACIMVSNLHLVSDEFKNSIGHTKLTNTQTVVPENEIYAVLRAREEEISELYIQVHKLAELIISDPSYEEEYRQVLSKLRALQEQEAKEMINFAKNMQYSDTFFHQP